MATEAGPEGPQLTLVVPAWNEEANLPSCVGQLHATFSESSYEVVIVDDGSRDQTGVVARCLAAEWPDRVRVATHERNQGFGAAMRTGFREARGRYVTCCPADFLMTPADWEPFASALGYADVIVGCRLRREGYNPLMRFNSWLYLKLIDLLFGLRLRDVNWISLYRGDLVRLLTITQSGVPMLAEILIKLRDLGATFREVDCRMQPRRVGVPSASRFRVMSRTLTGLLRLWRGYRPPPPRSSARSVSRPPELPARGAPT